MAFCDDSPFAYTVVRLASCLSAHSFSTLGSGQWMGQIFFTEVDSSGGMVGQAYSHLGDRHLQLGFMVHYT